MFDENNGEEELNCTPPDLLEEATSVSLNLLPQKSKEKYLKEHALFKKWCEERKANKTSENIVLAYFSEISKVLKPSSLWAKFSMLKTTLSVKENIDIKYPKLIAFLKRQSAGYKAKKSETFTREDVNKFLSEAPDVQFLMMKVVLVMGITGALRCDEMVKMTVDDITDKGSLLIVKIPDSKTRIQRTFVIDGQTRNGVNVVEIFRKYVALRPTTIDHRRFFINYRKGKCSVQVVGKNSLAKIPSIIAKFLGKENSEAYTGHCLRRTSAILLVDAGANILSLKRHGGWRSTSVAEGYINDSIANKKRASEKILGGENPGIPSSSSRDTETHVCATFPQTGVSAAATKNNIASAKDVQSAIGSEFLLNTAVTIHNANNCNFTINVHK